MTLLIDQPAVVLRPAGVVLVSGHDRLAYLHSLLSQQFEGVRAGTVADFLYLDAKGSAQAAGRAVVRAGDVVLVVAPEVAADLAAALDRFRFLMEVEVADVSGGWAVASVRGPGEVPGAGARSERMTAAPHGGGIVVRDRSGGVDLVGPADWVGERVAELGLPEAPPAAWAAWRIGAGLPDWGAEIAAGRRAQELGLLPTHVHLRKGCYPGQESIAKIHNLGRPRRALAVLETTGVPAPGAAVEVEAGGGSGRAGCEVTSAAAHGGGGLALGFVPLDREGRAPATVVVDGAVATVRSLVGEGLPQPGA